MKISKIPGLGNYGHYIDNIDFNHLTDEEWIEIGKLNLKGLVTILRNVNITKDQFYKRIPQFGFPLNIARANLMKKYGKEHGEYLDVTDPYFDFDAIADESDRTWLKKKKYLLEKTAEGNFLSRVTGKKDAEGNALGVFSNGDLAWHSDESSLTFAPGVGLLGGEHMVDSATGFVQTADIYESFSESFRSELNEMILIHRYHPGRVNQAEVEDKEFSALIKRNFCPEDNVEIPLVMRSPGGIVGLRYSVNTATSIKGLSDQDSDRIFKIIDSALFTEKNIFDHRYQQDNDLLLFDNSITIHRRIGGHPDRVAYRMAFNYCKLTDTEWQPWIHPEFADKYNTQIKELKLS